MGGLEIISQAVGLVAMVIMVFSFQFRENKRVLFWQAVSGAVFVVHFALQGAWGGVAMNVIGTVRSVVLIQPRRQRSYKVLFALWSAFLLCGLGVYFSGMEGGRLFLPVAAQMSGTYGMWSGTPAVLRIAMICGCSPLWITYNFLCHSLGGVLCETFNITSIIVYFTRMALARRREKKAAETPAAVKREGENVK